MTSKQSASSKTAREHGMSDEEWRKLINSKAIELSGKSNLRGIPPGEKKRLLGAAESALVDALVVALDYHGAKIAGAIDPPT